MSSGRYSERVLIASIVAGITYCFVGELIYRTLKNLNISRVFLTCVYFTLFFLFLGLCIHVAVRSIYWLKKRKINVRQWFLFLILIIGCSVVFEFIYDLVIKENKTRGIDSYIFVIDCSESMDQTDPLDMRYDAVEKLLNDKNDDFPYAIYVFDDSASCLRAMRPKSEQIDFEYPPNGNGTGIKNVFECIRQDIDSGKIAVTENCRIIFLTDGWATDISFINKGRFLRSLSDYSNRGISISTVGVIDSDISLMTAIAEKTDGVYVSVNDIGQLEEAIRTAGIENDNYKRDLLGYRSGTYMNWLLAFMRIVFVALLGMIIGLEKAVLCDRFLNTNSVIWTSLVLSAIAGIFIEIGMNTLGMNEYIVRAITCVLIAFTLVRDNPINIIGVGAQVKNIKGE